MRSFLLYTEAAILSLLIAFAALDLWHADLRVPFYYSMGSDVHFILAMIKTVAETGWYFENPWLGAPGTMKLYDFPFAETGTFLGVKLFFLLVRDPYLAGNFFYLATYVLASWSSLYVMRKFGVDDQVSVAASLLFAFTPYHFWRGMAHLHLSAYYPIPLDVMVSLWLCAGEPLFFRSGESGARAGRSLPVVVTALLVSMGGPYCAFFGTFLILIGGLVGWLRKPSWQRAVDAAASVGLVAGFFLLQVLPFLVGARREGEVPKSLVRTMDDYYVHALRIENLIRPTAGHRLPWLGQASLLNHELAPRELPSLLVQFGEARLCTPLGVLGTIGLFFLIAVALAAPFPLTRRRPMLGDLGKLCVASLLLGLNGGLGEVIASHVTLMIRCYNRISIYLSFFSYLALALLAGEPASGSRAGGWLRRPGSRLVICGVAALALLDQVPAGSGPDHRRDAAQFHGDRQLVRKIEQAVPPASMIFQLPVAAFPEGGTIGSMDDYNQFRGYFHSSRLRWSYGAMKGRDVARLQGELAELTPAERVERLRQLGFAGILIHRKGLPDAGREEIGWLLQVAPQVPIEGHDGDLVFFRLPGKR
jgi:phosphoglycerol transferase